MADDSKDTEDNKKAKSASPAGDNTEALTAETLGAQPIAVEAAQDAEDDNDSALGDDAASSTASLQSSIMQYRQENGRTYHAFKEQLGYVLPNDASEQDRLDLQHHLFTLTLHGKLHLSPAGETTPITRCLDIGTGTGVWAMDFADEHPETEVIGTDISPIQPSFVPPNLSFQIDDVEDEWTFSTKFDLVFARMMTGSIADWPRLFKQAFDGLAPGGWIECHDILFEPLSDDGTLKPDSDFCKWAALVLEAAAKFGRPGDSAKRYKQQMIEAGYVNVTEVMYRWPMNRWPADAHYKELGFWTFQDLAGGISGLSMALMTRGLGWAPEEVEVFLVKVRNEMKDRNIHAYWPIYVVYGQKPE